MAERNTKVTLTAQVQGYVAGMEKAAKATREAGTEAEKLAKQAEAFEQVGRGAIVAGGAMAVGLGLATKAAIDWESAWAGVTKTVDGTDAEMGALEGQLRSLATVLPAAHEEIAAVAEAAGQLGIQRENIAQFTRTMIDLGETTNLSADEAATSLARFMTVMGTNKSEVDRLGSALVELGNNYATTEAEIMAMGMRLSGAGAQIGLSEGQVLGLSTALSSVGIEAEAGGSAMSKVMISIASEVETGGDKLALFAETAGLSADEFAEKWRTAPAEALAAFVSGLANTEAQGKSTFGVLEDLGITEIRMRDALLRSSLAADQFAGAMQTGNEAVEENTALVAEAEKRYETTAAKISVMRNRIVDTAISMGEAFLPAIEAGAEAVGGLAEFLDGLPEPFKHAVAWIGAAGAAVLLTGGLALTAVPKIAAFKVALAELGITSASTAGKLKGVGAFLGGPWGVALAVATLGVYELNKAIQAGTPSQEELKNALLTSADAADALAKAGQRGGLEQFFMGDYAKNLEDLSGLFERTGDKANNFFVHAFTGTRNKDIGALGVLEEIGKVLAELSSTDLPRAQEEFRKLAESQNLTREEMQIQLERMPEFKDALVAQATEMGIAADESNLLKLALGEIGPAAEESGESVTTAAEAYIAAQDEASDLAGELLTLLDAYNKLNDIGQTSEQMNARLQESFAGLKEYIENAQAGIEGYSLGLDASTEAGSSNRAMLADYAGTVLDNANAQLELEQATLGAEEAARNYEQRLADGRQQIYDTALALAGNAEEAQKLTDKILEMPSSKEIEILMDTANAQWTVDRFIEANSNRTIRIAVGAGGQGGLTVDENGGFYERAFANGGILPGTIDSGFYSGEVHKFAETSLPWEAYISPKPSQRERNIGIWQETGRRLGVGKEILDALAGSGSVSSPRVDVTVNPGPGMSEAQIGTITGHRVAFGLETL